MSTNNKKNFSRLSSSSSSSSSSLLLSIILLLLVSTPSLTHAKCVIKQNCTAVGCRPVPVEPWETEPFPQPAPIPTCPQYASSGCCTLEQNTLLFVNFLSIQSAFSNIDNGGCPACAMNVEAFWCAYTCSPNQDEFVSVLGVGMMPDPTRGGELTEVLKTRVSLSPNFTCPAYESCEKVKTVSESSAMSNAEGFFAYQGQYEAIQHGAYIDIDYTQVDQGGNPNAVNPRPFSCCSYPTNPKNPSQGNSSCPCAYCSGMCSGGTCGGSSSNSASTLGDLTNNGWANGFQPASVGGLWGSVIAVMISITMWRRRKNNSKSGSGGGGEEGDEERRGRSSSASTTNSSTSSSYARRGNMSADSANINNDDLRRPLYADVMSGSGSSNVSGQSTSNAFIPR